MKYFEVHVCSLRMYQMTLEMIWVLRNRSRGFKTQNKCNAPCWWYVFCEHIYCSFFTYSRNKRWKHIQEANVFHKWYLAWYITIRHIAQYFFQSCHAHNGNNGIYIYILIYFVKVYQPVDVPRYLKVLMNYVSPIMTLIIPVINLAYHVWWHLHIQYM